MTRMGRRAIVVAIGFLISAGALWVVLQAIDLSDTVRVLAQAHPLLAAGIVGVVAVQVSFRAWRWSVLLPTERRLPFGRLLPPLLIGYLGNTVLPARLGEAMRAVVVARRERVGTTEALGSVVVERVIDVATLAVLAFLASLVVDAPTWAVQALGALAAGGVVGIGILSTVGVGPLVLLADRLGMRRSPRARDVVARFADTLGGPSRRRPIIAAAGISFIAWLLDATSFWLAGQAVGADLSYAAAMLVGGVAVLGTAIPSAPGFVGTFELAAAGMATALGVPGAEALAMAVVVHAMTLLPLALGGAASLIIIGADLGELARNAEATRHA